MDPFVWLEGFPAEERVGFIRRIFSAFEEIDPGFLQASRIWKMGKTVRIEAKMQYGGIPLSGSRDGSVGIHLYIEPDDPRLAKLVKSRLESDNLDLGRGQVQRDDGTYEPAFLASLGRGTLLLIVRKGEIMIRVTQRQMIPVPDESLRHLARSGSAVPGRGSGSQPRASFPRLKQEGFVAHLFSGQLYIVMQVNGVRQQEIDAVTSGPASLGLVKASENLLVLGVNVPNLTTGWADLPFALRVLPPEARRLNAPETDGCRVIMLVLLEGITGEVKALRPLRMSAVWSRTLEDLLEAQQDSQEDYDMVRYEKEVDATYRKWPTPNDMVGSMIAMETVQKEF